MVTNYYNASNNFSAPIRREPKPFRPAYGEREHRQEQVQEAAPAAAKPKTQMDQDTLLILGLVLLLLMSGCDDTLLLIALGYLILF